MQSAIVPLAQGVEEMEAVIIIDVLRRAGLRVVGAGVQGATVTASRGVRLLADCLWEEVAPSDFDALILPGGMEATRTLSAHASVLHAVRHFAASRKLAAAVCAAPLVLHAAGVLSGRNVTSHPSVSGELRGAVWHDASVVADGNIITSQGAGTSLEFALAIVRYACDKQTARTVAEAIVFRYPSEAGPA